MYSYIKCTKKTVEGNAVKQQHQPISWITLQCRLQSSNSSSGVIAFHVTQAQLKPRPLVAAHSQSAIGLAYQPHPLVAAHSQSAIRLAYQPHPLVAAHSQSAIGLAYQPHPPVSTEIS